MSETNFKTLAAGIRKTRLTRSIGRISSISSGTISVIGISNYASVGDDVLIEAPNGAKLNGEVLNLTKDRVCVLVDGPSEGLVLGSRVTLLGQKSISPANSWLGRIIDPTGKPLDGGKLFGGPTEKKLKSPPPNPTKRRSLGARLETGMTVFNTLLPIVQGQRIGLFSGSGVGKSTLLGNFAKGVHADVVIIALIGERGREVREFVEHALGPGGMEKAVVVAATSDQSPLLRRQCAFSAMAVAEFFRDQGLHVLLLADSITRFAEAHREVALSGGEEANLRGFPSTTSQIIMGLCERAGPGAGIAGDITAVFTVLVAGSDMEEPIADILRGVLDGHVVLSREIAERGRFPAVDLLKSVSRSLPNAASQEENRLIGEARSLLGAYERTEMMLQAGLYSVGSDPLVDQSILSWPKLDYFISQSEQNNTAASFEVLAECVASEQ